MFLLQWLIKLHTSDLKPKQFKVHPKRRRLFLLNRPLQPHRRCKTLSHLHRMCFVNRKQACFPRNTRAGHCRNGSGVKSSWCGGNKSSGLFILRFIGRLEGMSSRSCAFRTCLSKLNIDDEDGGENYLINSVCMIPEREIWLGVKKRWKRMSARTENKTTGSASKWIENIKMASLAG